MRIGCGVDILLRIGYSKCGDECMSRILIIEDEEKIREILTEFLRDAGYETDEARDGVEGLTLLRQNHYDLVLLDILMPKIDGFAVLELLRRESDVPVVLLTALEAEEHQLRGFDLHADDYITKPFSMNLVLRRIEAVLRRKQSQPAPDTTHILTRGKVTLDTKSCEVRVSGQVTPVTYKEYELLKLFLEYPNKVFTREELLRQVWGYDFNGDDRAVNNHIMRMRKKLEEGFIVTVRGMGYRLGK